MSQRPFDRAVAVLTLLVRRHRAALAARGAPRPPRPRPRARALEHDAGAVRRVAGRGEPKAAAAAGHEVDLVAQSRSMAASCSGLDAPADCRSGSLNWTIIWPTASVPPRRLAGVPRVPHSVSRCVPSRRIVRQRVSSRVVRRRVVRHEATRSRAASGRGPRTDVARGQCPTDVARGRAPWTSAARRAAAYALPVLLAGALTAGCAGFRQGVWRA